MKREGENAMRRLSNNYHVKSLGISILLSVIVLAIGCATTPERNPALDRARSAYEQAAANPEVKKNAPVTMYEAEQALKIAEQAKNVEEMNYLSFRAERMAQIAVAEADEKTAVKEREELSKKKDKMVLQARELETKRAISLAEARALEAERAKKETEEKAREIERAKGEAQALAQQADKARKDAEARALEIQQARGEAEAKALEAERLKKEAEAKALEAESSKKEAEAKTLELEKARKEAEAKRLETELARTREEEAIAQRKQLESELSELKAKQTEKGIVLTLGDILFETGKAHLLPGAVRSIDILADFLKKYQKRHVLIEGFTDSFGTETYNLGLSQQRADAVRDALGVRGIVAERITARGYGEQFPIASNKTSAGRQQNRRVEIIILDEGVSAEKMKR
jgi:outer membrane protein OmpA-like peptidoglycan-associated protein